MIERTELDPISLQVVDSGTQVWTIRKTNFLRSGRSRILECGDDFSTSSPENGVVPDLESLCGGTRQKRGFKVLDKNTRTIMIRREN
jgi:hypothetical protein